MADDRLRILAVEDEAMIALELEDMLGDLGYAVIGPVPTVEEALALLRGARPDAAIVDANLAGDSAAPIVAALRADRIPFVLASGYEAFDLRALAADGPLVRKPYSARDLAKALDAIGVSRPRPARLT